MRLIVNHCKSFFLRFKMLENDTVLQLLETYQNRSSFFSFKNFIYTAPMVEFDMTLLHELQCYRYIITMSTLYNFDVTAI